MDLFLEFKLYRIFLLFLDTAAKQTVKSPAFTEFPPTNPKFKKSPIPTKIQKKYFIFMQFSAIFGNSFVFIQFLRIFTRFYEIFANLPPPLNFSQGKTLPLPYDVNDAEGRRYMMTICCGYNMRTCSNLQRHLCTPGYRSGSTSLDHSENGYDWSNLYTLSRIHCHRRI